MEFPQGCLHALRAPVHVTRRLATATSDGGAQLIGMVGMEPALHPVCRPSQHAAPHSHLQGLEIPLLDWTTQQRSYLRPQLTAQFGG